MTEPLTQAAPAMNEKTYVGVLAMTFGLFFFVVSLLTIFLPGFGEIHLGMLASLASFIETVFPAFKNVAFMLAMFLDWIIVFGTGFAIGALLVMEVRKRYRGKWEQLAQSNSIQMANWS